ncbi:MAG: type II toxin-antitoxin system RelE/ParE family toxin [Burkholderiales bacterium]
MESTLECRTRVRWARVLFELRCQGSEGIGRSFYCTLVGQEIVILNSFIKKTQETRPADLAVTRKRQKAVKNGQWPLQPGSPR